MLLTAVIASSASDETIARPVSPIVAPGSR